MKVFLFGYSYSNLHSFFNYRFSGRKDLLYSTLNDKQEDTYTSCIKRDSLLFQYYNSQRNEVSNLNVNNNNLMEVVKDPNVRMVEKSKAVIKMKLEESLAKAKYMMMLFSKIIDFYYHKSQWHQSGRLITCYLSPFLCECHFHNSESGIRPLFKKGCRLLTPKTNSEYYGNKHSSIQQFKSTFYQG